MTSIRTATPRAGRGRVDDDSFVVKVDLDDDGLDQRHQPAPVGGCQVEKVLSRPGYHGTNFSDAGARAVLYRAPDEV